jgi:hypothetical protein
MNKTATKGPAPGSSLPIRGESSASRTEMCALFVAIVFSTRSNAVSSFRTSKIQSFSFRPVSLSLFTMALANSCVWLDPTNNNATVAATGYPARSSSSFASTCCAETDACLSNSYCSGSCHVVQRRMHRLVCKRVSGHMSRPHFCVGGNNILPRQSVPL